jgi:protein N-terminal methyltransferase
MIWIQWVLLYLTDEDLVSFLKRCLAGLKEGGLICVKENITSGSRYFYDRDDNSVTRNDSQFKRVFGAAGLKLVLEMDQDRFPQDLFTVRMYALAGQ